MAYLRSSRQRVKGGREEERERARERASDRERERERERDFGLRVRDLVIRV